MKIYLAAPFEEILRLQTVKADVEALGHQVVSSWLEESPESSVDLPQPDWSRFALRDLQEVKGANLLILDTFAANLRGGSQVEYGYAIGFQRPVWIVGPVRNVFHTLAQWRCENWEEALGLLARGGKDR